MASFLGGIISSRDNATFVLGALQLVECLVIKLPEIYLPSFHREGVVFEIEQLASQETQPKPPPTSVVKTEPVDNFSIDSPQYPPFPHAVRPKPVPTPADLGDANVFRARVLAAKRTFELGDGDNSAAVALGQLEKLAERLVDEDADEAQLRETLREIAVHFADADRAVSSFELLKSGLVDGLLQFVTTNDTGE